jgi:predicted TIM-barrel fold metal-dependent hydrolase
VFEELNRRNALVYVHPIAPDCCHNLVPDLADAVIEYTTDTTRAIARWMFSGSAARYPNVRLIWSHGGGVAPFIAERLYRVGAGPLGKNVPDGVVPQLQKFYYDVAQAAHPYALASLTKLIPISQILFGTDYPYRLASEYVQLLGEYGFDEKDLRAIDCDNALRLLPRFKR